MEPNNSPIKFTYCNHCKSVYSYPDHDTTPIDKDKRYCPNCSMNGEGDEKPRDKK